MQDTVDNVRALTNDRFWNRIYRQRSESADLQVKGFRNRPTRIIAELIEGLGLEDKSVLEIGGGDSAWLPYFAQKHPQSRFAALDYSREGCERLRQRLGKRGITNVDVYEADFTQENKTLQAAFDIVLSFGVVEHFDRLDRTLRAKKQYVKPGGLVFTIIPNLAGFYGKLARRWNPGVYQTHTCHDWCSFSDGHRKAGLRIVDGGYLGTTEFGILSMCFVQAEGPSRIDYLAYLYLTRFSKLLHLFEDHFGSLPATRLLSPYIYAIGLLSQEQSW